MSGRAEQCSGRVRLRLVAPLNEFETVAPGVFGIEAVRVGQIFIPKDGIVVSQQLLAQSIEVLDCKGRVRFLGWTKLCFHADMQLLPAALKPATASAAQCVGLLDLGHSKNPAIEFPCGCFAAGRRSNLQVVDAQWFTFCPTPKLAEAVRKRRGHFDAASAYLDAHQRGSYACGAVFVRNTN